MAADRLLPMFDATTVCQTFVDAPPDVVTPAINEADLLGLVKPCVPAAADVSLNVSVRRENLGCVVRCEARIAAAEETAARRLGDEWREAAPGVELVMHRWLRSIKHEAEHQLDGAGL